MAGNTEQQLVDGLVVTMVDNSPYEALAGSAMPDDMYDNMVSAMERLAAPIHEHVVTWWNETGGGIFPDEKVKMTLTDPVSGFLSDKIDDNTIIYDETTLKLKIGNITSATDSVVGGVIVGATEASGLFMTGNEIYARIQTNTSLSDSNNEMPSSRAVKLYVDNAILGIISGGGIGDMIKSTYDTNTNGIVDNAESLDGELPSYYLAWANLTDTPTTMSGYGITDAYTQTNLQTSGQSLVHWGNITDTPTTMSGYGITDGFSGFDTLFNDYGYTEPTHAFGDLTSTPTTLSGYGITDAEPGLGNPSTDGHILSSTTGGIRSWVANNGLINLEDSGANVINTGTGTGYFQYGGLKLNSNIGAIERTTTGSLHIIASNGDLILRPLSGIIQLGDDTYTPLITSHQLNAKGSTNVDIIFTPKGTGTLSTSSGHTTNIAADNDIITKGYADTNYGGMVYPNAGIVRSTGSGWDLSITSLSGLNSTLGTNIGEYNQITISSSSTPTPEGGYRENDYFLTALTVNTIFQTPSGTPDNGNTLLIRIKDSGTARTLDFTTATIYRAVGVTLPTTTVISKTMYIGCIYNSTDSKWDVVSVAEEA